MARLLVERETIFTEEVDMLMEGKSVEEIMAFMDENEHTLRENPFNRKSVIISEKELKKNKEEKPIEVGEEKKEAEATAEKESKEEIEKDESEKDESEKDESEN